MGYQALLFCTDEKLARVVSQLFSELEFAVTAVNDPFAAVKNLMALHYDAVVIDCENEQSAGLLVKSARSSSSNQGSLAIGLVEGQAGVAKAYRMGANLVLTKPINVEQAKGTLRVARGLLRKVDAGAHAASAPAKAAPAAASTTSAAPSQQREPITHAVENTATPMASASQHSAVEDIPALAPPIRIKPWTSITSQPPAEEPQPAPDQFATPPASVRPQVPVPAARTEAAPAPRAAVVPFVAAVSKAHGGAAAPAPAKETVRPATQPVPVAEEEEYAAESASHASHPHAFTAETLSPSPSFSAGMDHPSGSGQKILIGAVAVVALAVAGYFGWTKFGQSPSAASATSAPLSAAQAPSSLATSQLPPQSAPQATPDLRPGTASAQPLASAGTHSALSSTAASYLALSQQTSHLPANQPSAAQAAANAPTIGQGSTLREAAQTKSEPAPIFVRSGPVKSHQQQPQTQEEASALPPSALGMAAPSDAALSGVLNATVSKPSLSRTRISQGVLQGLLIKQVPPHYPANALATHTEGAVQIEATVDKEGHVVNPKVLSGPSVLAPAALEAVRQWRYKPYYLDGEPVAIQTQITIKFKAQ